MPRFKLFATAGVCAALSVSAHVVARYTESAAMTLEQQASGGGQPERVNIRPPDGRRAPPPDQQQQIDDFAPPPVRMDADEKLIPIDPEQRRKSELAIQYWEISHAAGQAVWILPVAGVFLMLMVRGKRRTAEIEQETKKEAPAGETLPDAGGGPGTDGSVPGASSSGSPLKEGKSDESPTDPRCSVSDGPGDSGDGEELPVRTGAPGSLSGILRDLPAEPGSLRDSGGSDGKAAAAES
jgi:hypothetical protein